MDKKSKIVLIVKVFLTSNKGKWYSSKELCDFINNGKFRVGNGIASTQLSKLLTTDVLRRENISKDRKNSKNVWYYGVV